MRAFASNWTRPYAMQHPGQPYALPDYELLTTILSALMWRRYNGSICMLTDRVGDRYYRSLGLADIWDDGIHCALDDIPYTIDPSTFWAAGKLYALKTRSAPCVMLDTDFIVWSDIQPQLQLSALTVIHRESLQPDIYPEPNAFSLDSNYIFPSDWDWQQPACNTALCYFGDEMLRREYVAQAIDFMHAVRGRDGLIYMVFAEQRLLAMCAHAMHVTIHSLSTSEQLFSGNQTDFTHVWGLKQGMQRDDALRQAFCERCAQRIARDFPPVRTLCANIPILRQYF